MFLDQSILVALIFCHTVTLTKHFDVRSSAFIFGKPNQAEQSADATGEELTQRPKLGQLLAGSPKAQIPNITIRPTYSQELAAWVQKHSSYPLLARSRGIEGTAILRLTISPEGSLDQASVDKTSGHSILDDEALRTAHAANPYPPLPDNSLRASADFLVPVTFRLESSHSK